MITQNKLKQMMDIADRSEWSPAKADGRNQLERIGTIYSLILLKSMQRNPASFVIASPSICALLERISRDFKPIIPSTFDPNEPDQIHKVGTFENDKIELYRNIKIDEDYVLIAEHLDDVTDPNSYQLITVSGLIKPEYIVICKDCGTYNVWRTNDGCFWLDNYKKLEPQKCQCGTELKESDKRLTIGEDNLRGEK